MRLAFLISLFSFIACNGFTQEVFWPTNFDFRWDQDSWLRFETDSLRHFGLRQNRATIQEDSTYSSWYNAKYGRSVKNKFIGKKLFNEHLLQFKYKDTRIWADALLNFQGGTDLEDTSSTSLYTNTRGLQIQGYITDKLYFYFSFYENQSLFPNYLATSIRNSRAVPGQGTPKPFGDGGFDYNMATGFVRYTPVKGLAFQYGHDKLFIGEGYRSVLLSDNAFNFPFLQTEVSFFKNKMLYQTNFALLQELKRSNRTLDSEAIYRRKLANINYLSFKPIPKLEIGVSEVVMWQRWDDSTGTLPYEPLFLNPVPFVNSLVKIDSLNQSYLGINMSYSPINQYVVYGQALYSNESVSAYQIGVKAYDAFRLKGLFLMGEYNKSEEAYGSSDLQTDFWHYGQNMAFVQGNNSSEIIGSARYSLKGLYAQVRAHSIERVQENISIVSLEGGYLFNPRYNLSIYGGAMLRDSDLVGATQWFYAGLRTSILNTYYDF